MKTRLIYGPPGTGKTTALLGLLEEELKSVPPSQIAYVSFTREGSDQGKRRAMSAFRLKEDDFPYFRTLHSLAFRECNMARECVMGKKQYAHFSKKMGMNFTGYYTEDLRNNDDLYLFFDEVYRNTPSAAEFYMDTLDMEKLKFVRKNYKAYKEQFSLYDFTDMIELFLRKGSAVPVRVAFIDEAQDLTALQWKMVWSAFRHCDRVYIAGDDDQAIYQWSGADVNYFLSLEGDATILRQSYRVPEDVRRFAVRITDQIKKRVEKTYHGRDEQGLVKNINSLDELTFNPNETYMILSRNNYFLSAVDEFLRNKGEVFVRKGESSLPVSTIRAIDLYERERKEGGITQESFYKIREFLVADYSAKDPWYESFNIPPEESSYIRRLIKEKKLNKTPNIRVSTIHGVKGGEADHVIMLSDMTKSTYTNLQKNPDSEHRVFYVGATRAKKTLTIVHPSSRMAYPIRSLE